MKKKIRMKIIVSVVLVIFTTNCILIANSSKVSAKEYYLKLTGITYKSSNYHIRDSHHPDYFNLIKQQLDRIGIYLDVQIRDWPTFLGEIIAFRNFDLLIMSLSDFGNLLYDLPYYVYRENSSLNMAGYHTDMDWDNDLGTGKNEWYLKENQMIMPPNSNERIQNYHEWQNYMMDEILPVQPLFNDKHYVQSWDTLSGYNYSEGLIQSWGKMSWDSLHEGQMSTNEIVISNKAWSDLNPLFHDDSASMFMCDAILDPLFWLDSDKTIQPHLATNFEMLNDTYCRIHLREDIKWQSDPDGNFTDEYFDAEDVYFTLFAWKELSNDQQLFDWIDDMKIVNNYTLDLFIDGDPSTSENEPYADFLKYSMVKILPEHYLNQTQFPNGESDVTHTSWNIFATNCFGTGLFQRSAFNEGWETILSVNPNSWWLNTTITNDPELDWSNRFGDFTGGLNQLRIRINQDDNLAQQEFENGSVDISRISSSKPQNDNNYLIQSEIARQLTSIYYNMRPVRDYIGDRTPCSNDPSITKGLALRKAMSYAINVEEINDIVHGGERHKTDYPIFESQGIWCNPDIIRYDYDLEKARYYMNLAGFTDTIIIGFDSIELIYFIFIIPIFIISFQRKRQSGLKRYEK